MRVRGEYKLNIPSKVGYILQLILTKRLRCQKSGHMVFKVDVLEILRIKSKKLFFA